MFIHLTATNHINKVIFFNFREYWQDEMLTYECINGELGIEASNNITIRYPCIWKLPKGDYDIPEGNNSNLGNWPICMERTTTIKTRKYSTSIF